MDILQALILGVVQGIAEFLPISSSGHLAVFQTLLGVEEPSFFYDVLLHVATLVPIFIVFWEDIWELIKNPFQKTTYLLIVATLPTVFFVLIFGDITDAIFASGVFLPVTFIMTGLFLLYADYASAKTSENENNKEIGYVEAIIIGLMQSLGTMPGVSRSGSTLTGALASGISREKAAKFSFLMAIPAILGALFLQVVDIFQGDVVLQIDSIFPMLLGCIAAAVSGYLSINFLLEVIKRAKLKYFSYYVFALAGFLLICQFGFGMTFVTS